MAAAAPFALALVVADSVHVDPGSGKATILGTFSTIFAMEFPAVHQIMAVYFAVTDGREKCDLNIRIVDVDEENTLIESSVSVVFDDPRNVIEGMTAFMGVSFPQPGEYRLQLRCHEELLLERRIMLRKKAQ